MQNKTLFTALACALALCACTPEPNVAIRIDCGDFNNKGINTAVNGKPVGECPVDIMVHAGQTLVEAKGEDKDSTFYAKTELTLAENSMKRISLLLEGTYKESYYAERATDIPTMEAYLQHYPQGAKAAELKTALVVAKTAQAAIAKLAPGLEMVVMPAGSFQMGDLSGTGFDSEKPVHKVTLKSFAMSKTEITFAQYDTYAEAAGVAKPKDEGWGRGNRPVINVSWNDAVAYAKWLNEKTGKHFRLPSEQEWEYAARAGSITDYPWGAAASHTYANYGTDDCCEGLAIGKDQWVKTAPVGQFPPNGFGLYDMHGNVWEWLHDCYQDSYKDTHLDSSAVTSSKCERRVVRGGSWGNGPINLRSSERGGNTPTYRDSYNGFRLAQDN